MHLFSKIYFHRETFSGFHEITYRTTTSGASPTSSSQEKDSSSHPPFAKPFELQIFPNAVFVFPGEKLKPHVVYPNV